MEQKIQLLKNPDPLHFPGEHLFSVVKNGYSNFNAAPDDVAGQQNQPESVNIVVPVKSGNTGIFNNGNYIPTGVSLPAGTPAPNFPDFTKLTCAQLQQQIDRINEYLTNSKMAKFGNSAELVSIYENALASANAVYAKSCNVQPVSEPVKHSLPVWVWIAGAVVVIMAFKKINTK